MKILITKEMMASAKPKNGAYSRAQHILGQKLTGKYNWGDAIRGIEVDEFVWHEFLSKGVTTSNKKVKAAISKKEISEKQKRRKIKTETKKSYFGDFYNSDAWRALRVRVLETHGCKCMMCGRSPKDHNVIVHVDHIQPRSKRPDLELNFENLQVLCEDCNLGKGNKYNTDWRP